MSPIVHGRPGFLGIRLYKGFLNRVYSILQLKYGYSVYHFLWTPGIQYTMLPLILGIFGWILGIFGYFGEFFSGILVYHCTPPPPPPPPSWPTLIVIMCLLKQILTSKENVMSVFVNMKYRYVNRLYSYSQYWTGTSLQWRLMQGNLFKCKYFLIYFPALASIAS